MNLQRPYLLDRGVSLALCLAYFLEDIRRPLLMAQQYLMEVYCWESAIIYLRRWSNLSKAGLKNPLLRQLKAFDDPGDPESEEGDGDYDRRLASYSEP